MEIFESNTLASFRNFLNDEIQLSGDWRVALSEIIFPTKIENIVNGNPNVYNLKDYEVSQKMSSGANVISRSYSRQKLCQEHLIRWCNFLPQLSAQLDCPILLSEKLRAPEILPGKYEGIKFPSEEIPSIIGFEGISDGNGVHIGNKMNPNAIRLMKSDETKAYYGEFPADLCAGKHPIFIYTNIIEYQ